MVSDATSVKMEVQVRVRSEVAGREKRWHKSLGYMWALFYTFIFTHMRTSHGVLLQIYTMSKSSYETTC
jgi:hypothetical protein